MNVISVNEQKRNQKAAENRRKMESALYKMGHFHAADGTPMERLSISDLTVEYASESCRTIKVKQVQTGVL
ncbi:hypothetical protein [Sediminibacillus halophilus]|uniref:Uncharacterized protein n=1 Tax=Sediminibacillus halophilus TaxID=482461 RepID=A0A1G9QWK6_9BACI|nr:hypothetical protein [Sediminibacillus halophilus]SDM15261.1 hypothetical protein SAMN05216244_1698 [Sediminibacillus halophilus]